MNTIALNILDPIIQQYRELLLLFLTNAFNNLFLLLFLFYFLFIIIIYFFYNKLGLLGIDHDLANRWLQH